MKNLLTGMLLLATFAMVTNAAMAQGRGYQHGKAGMDQALRTEIHQYILDGNYEKWKELMSQHRPWSRTLQVINEDNFDEFSKAHKFINSGETAEGSALLSRLGLGKGKGQGRGQGKGLHNGRFCNQNGDDSPEKKLPERKYMEDK